MSAPVVIFGATGFVGRNLTAYLKGTRERIVAVSHSGVAVDGATECVAIRDIESIAPLQKGTIAINVAAYRYDASRAASLHSDILVANTAIVNRFYEFCLAFGITEVRAASSVAVYPANRDLLDDLIPVDLNTPPNPSETFYAWSKRWGEIVADLYREKYGISTLSFRLSNPYGPHDSLDEKQAHVLPAFVIRALRTQGDFEIRGNPDVERDFIYVGDVCDVFARSLTAEGQHGAMNLCRGETTTLREMAETIFRLTGQRRQIVSMQASAQGVAVRRSTNATVIKRFGKSDFCDLAAGLAPTISWYAGELGLKRH